MVHGERVVRRHRARRGAVAGPGTSVHFTPGARTAWHQHTVGQTLHVTGGVAWTQARGGRVEEVTAGETVHTPPGEWHWHGAAPDRFMTHLAIWEAPGGDAVETEWGKHVTDAEYGAGRPTA